MKEWAVGNAARSGQLGECRPLTQAALSLLTLLYTELPGASES